MSVFNDQISEHKNEPVIKDFRGIAPQEHRAQSSYLWCLIKD